MTDLTVCSACEADILSAQMCDPRLSPDGKPLCPTCETKNATAAKALSHPAADDMLARASLRRRVEARFTHQGQDSAVWPIAKPLPADEPCMLCRQTIPAHTIAAIGFIPRSHSLIVCRACVDLAAQRLAETQP